MPGLISRCGGCGGLIDSTTTAGDTCGVHSVGSASGRVLTADGFGGSDWLSLPTSTPIEEHCIVGVTTVNAGSVLALTWAHYQGSVILDRTVVTQPKFTARGLYTLSFTLEVGNAAAAGDGFDASCFLVQSVIGWPPAGITPGFVTAAAPTGAGLVRMSSAVTGVMQVNDTVILQATNRSGANVTVQASVSVVRVQAF